MVYDRSYAEVVQCPSVAPAAVQPATVQRLDSKVDQLENDSFACTLMVIESFCQHSD